MTRYDPEAELLIAQFRLVLSAVRDIRSRNGIPYKKVVGFSVKCDGATTEGLLLFRAAFLHMANATLVDAGPHVEGDGLVAQVSIPPTKVSEV